MKANHNTSQVLKDLEKKIKEKGMTISGVAKEIGVEKSTLTRNFKGESAMALETYLKICQVLGSGPTFRPTMFFDVLEKMETDFEYRDDLVGVTAQKYGYHLSFYGRKEDGHKLVIDEFGRLVPGDPVKGVAKEFIHYQPTPGQLELMQHILGAELRKLQKRLKEEDAHQAEVEARAEEDWQDWRETMESLYRTER